MYTSTLTAGTHPGSNQGGREPHRFVAEKTSDWGYRPRCGVCGQERGDARHPEQARKR